jgi:hypothetical protein
MLSGYQYNKTVRTAYFDLIFEAKKAGAVCGRLRRPIQKLCRQYYEKV